MPLTAFAQTMRKPWQFNRKRIQTQIYIWGLILELHPIYWGYGRFPRNRIARGNPVKNRGCPAAVTGNNRHSPPELGAKTHCQDV